MLKRLVVKYLREAADKISSGNCELTEAEAMDILRVISHEALSKELVWYKDELLFVINR